MSPWSTIPALIVLAPLSIGPARSVKAQETSTISGRVIFTGNPANYTRTKINRAKDPQCALVVKAIGTEKVVLNKKTEPITLRNVLISVKEGLGDRTFDPPATPRILTQVGCQYRPHVLGIMAGQTLKVLNGDNTNHNIHFLPRVNVEHNFSQPQRDVVKGRELRLVTEEPFKVKCDVHPWMGCYIAVFDHPFFDVTNKDGVYELRNVPPGKYVIQVWHETFGSFTTTVQLTAGEEKELDFIYGWSVVKPQP